MDGGGGGQRRRWNDGEQPRRTQASLYAEWLRAEKSAAAVVTPSARDTRRQSLPLQHQHQHQHQHGSTSTASSDAAVLEPTIRPVTADDSEDMDDEGAIVPERGTNSFEEAFLPRSRPSPILGTTTTTIVGGPAALSGPAAPGVRSSRHSRRLQKERELRNFPSPEQNGSGLANVLARTSSKNGGASSNGTRVAHGSVDEGDAYNGGTRQRTRTLDERRRERSPTHALKSSRNRVGSVNNLPSSGAEYLASVPASTSPPTALSVLSLNSPVQSPGDIGGRRSSSPPSSANNSMTSKSSTTRRILHLRDVLKGRMSGHVLLRRDRENPWTQLYCYIREDTGRLMYEPKGGDGVTDRALVSALAGCSVRANTATDPPYLEVTLAGSDTEIHFKLLTQADFDSWFAALLWWQYQDPSPAQANGQRPPSSNSASQVTRPEPPPRTSSARDRRDRAGSNKSDRRKSVVTPKEAPVIKIGQMTLWDTNVGFSNTPVSPSGLGHAASGRPAKYKMQGQGSRRWRRISGQLRENGELKLHTEADNSLISVVQLSQLSREAIQRLDPSVLENDFCIAIYPQYTSGVSNSQPGFVRPIFLSLENRVLYEVWFVLLRAFTIPQLYGPPPEESHEKTLETQELEEKLATTTTDMFRMERTLNFRVVEAKMYPPPANNAAPEAGFSGGRSHQAAHAKPEHHGYYAEVLLDDETRGRTTVKFDGSTPLWGESFEFLDLPAVLSSVSVVIKRRPPESAHAREQHESKLVHEAYGFTSDQHGGFTGLTFDTTCGKVEVYLHELEGDKDLEKWWPIVNMYNQRVGEVLLKTRMNEGVILMQNDYAPLSELLHRFTNGLTLQIAQIIPGELKRVSDCLLNIFQVSGKVGDWIMALVEDEIDGNYKETPITRLRYSNRIGSDASTDSPTVGPAADRELIVRDMNKNAALEANLLFRGNTLLTKSLDTHMRRIGKEYLEEALGAKIKEINDRDPECEVDPNRAPSEDERKQNWKRLHYHTKEVWNSILASKNQCPVELRLIFRHIRACAEDRYGDFLRSVSFSSVSGFLFLRFFCPAILNPKLFGVLKEDLKPRARRTLTLIAKSLQTMSNMASFGAKETWMEPMNGFLLSNRESFKSLIDDMCYVPVTVSGPSFSNASNLSPTYPPGVVSAETHLSYTTPMTIMQRLPPTSREGFPSLPYLIDQARAFAELVLLWLDATSEVSSPSTNTANAKSHAELINAIRASEGELMAFHQVCATLSKRTQECLNRAERADRPNSALSFKWEELIDQLQPNSHPDSGDELPLTTPQTSSLDTLAEHVAVDPLIASPTSHPSSLSREWDVIPHPDDETTDDDADPSMATRLYNTTNPPSTSASQTAFDFPPHSHSTHTRDRPGSSGVVSNIRESLRRAKLQSRGSATGVDNENYSPTRSSAHASASASVVSSDTEHSAGTTALPNYEREKRHRERREAAKVQIKQEVEAARLRESHQRERRRRKTPIVSALRKKKERDGAKDGGGDGGGGGSGVGYASHG